MKAEYKIELDKGQRVISYEDNVGGMISEIATTEEDFAVVQKCRDLATLLNSEGLEVIIKSK